MLLVPGKANEENGVAPDRNNAGTAGFVELCLPESRLRERLLAGSKKALPVEYQPVQITV